jgi:hypothetical protein
MFRGWGRDEGLMKGRDEGRGRDEGLMMGR